MFNCFRKPEVLCLKETNSFSEIKTQVKGNTAIIAKFAAQLLLLIFLIGLIIYSLPS